ncbi:MAG: L,D-transpeptidase family protein [Woeseia sp.]
MRATLATAMLILFSTTPAVAADRVPAWLLELPASVGEILIANADDASLYRFENNGRGIVQLDERYMSIGRNGVGKQRAWDRKTPLGIYFITEELDTSRLHDKYGDAAFVLDYPNAWDRYLKRTGDGIWLHGVDRNDPERPPLDTDGCLALPNEEIVRIADDLQPLVTPVIVARELQWAPASDIAKTRAEFRRALARWQTSINEGDVAGYLALYSADFRQQDMDKNDWSTWRANVFAARGDSDVTLRDVMLLADPEEAGLYLSRFTQVMVSDGQEVLTQKRLYWRRNDAQDWQIVTEDHG